MRRPLTWCPLVSRLTFCTPGCWCTDIQGIQIIRSIGYLFILTVPAYTKPTEWEGVAVGGGGVHIDLLTPSLSTMERLRPRLNVQSVVGNRALLLWLRRRGVTPSVRSSRAPLLLLPHTPRRGCLQRLPLAEQGAHSCTTSVSFRFVFRIVSRFELHHTTQGATPKCGSPYPQLEGPPTWRREL